MFRFFIFFKVLFITGLLAMVSCKSKSIRHEGLRFAGVGEVESNIVSEETAREYDDFAYNFFRYLQLEQFDDAYNMLHSELQQGIQPGQFASYFKKQGLLINEVQFEAENVQGLPVDNEEALELGFIYYDGILSKYRLNFENQQLYLNMILSKNKVTNQVKISGLVLGPGGQQPDFVHIMQKAEVASKTVQQPVETEEVQQTTGRQQGETETENKQSFKEDKPAQKKAGDIETPDKEKILPAKD